MGPLFVSAKVIVYSSPISKILLVAIPISKTGISAKLLIAFPYQQNVSKMQAIVLSRFPTKINKSTSYYNSTLVIFFYFTLAFLGVLLVEILFYLYCTGTRAFVLVAAREQTSRESRLLVPGTVRVQKTWYQYWYCVSRRAGERTSGQGTRVLVPGSKHISALHCI